MSGPPTVLLTRARPQGEATAARLAARGHVALVAPLMRVEAVADPPAALAAPMQAILVTSPNGAAGLAAHGVDRGVPVLAVGARTAADLRAAGFSDVTSAGGDAAALGALAVERLSPGGGTVLHARGETVIRSPLTALRAAGFGTAEAVLYRTVPTGGFDAAAVARMGGLRAALVYSPGSAARLRGALDALPPGSVPPLDLVAISAAAAAPLAGSAHIRASHAAVRPVEAALFAVLDGIAQKPVAPPDIRG